MVYAGSLDNEGRGWFMQKYAEWREAFETAAQGGCVNFH